MSIQSKSEIRSYFEGGDTPSTAQFAHFIDTAIRDPLVAIATAGEAGNVGALQILATAAVTLRSALGSVGMQLLSTQTTASAANIIPTISPATTAQAKNDTLTSAAYMTPGVERYGPFAVKGYVNCCGDSGTIFESYRVSSAGAAGAGKSLVKWSKAMPTAKYTLIGWCDSAQAGRWISVFPNALSIDASGVTIGGNSNAGPGSLSRFSLMAFCSGE